MNPGKEVGIDFVQTSVQEGTQFWRFDEQTQTWEEADQVTTFVNPDTNQVLVGFDVDTISGLTLDWSDNRKLTRNRDTIAQLQAAYAMIPDILDSLEYFAEKDRSYFSPL